MATTKTTYLALTPDEFLRKQGGVRPDGSHESFSVVGHPLEWMETAVWAGVQENRTEVRTRKVTKLLVMHYVTIPDPPKPTEDETEGE